MPPRGTKNKGQNRKNIQGHSIKAGGSPKDYILLETVKESESSNSEKVNMAMREGEDGSINTLLSHSQDTGVKDYELRVLRL